MDAFNFTHINTIKKVLEEEAFNASLQNLRTLGVGSLAPEKPEGVVFKVKELPIKEVQELGGQQWGRKAPNPSLANEEWRWEAHTPSCFRPKRERSKEWPSHHSKVKKALAKRQGLVR